MTFVGEGENANEVRATFAQTIAPIMRENITPKWDNMVVVSFSFGI